MGQDCRGGLWRGDGKIVREGTLVLRVSACTEATIGEVGVAGVGYFGAQVSVIVCRPSRIVHGLRLLLGLVARTEEIRRGRGDWARAVSARAGGRRRARATSR